MTANIDNTDITDQSRRDGFAGGPMLSIENVHARQYDRAALRGVDLAIAPGEIVGLSGDISATSALRDCLIGRLRWNSGTIRLAGKALNGLSPSKVLAAGLVDADNVRRVKPGDSMLEDVAGAASGGAAPSRRGLLAGLLGGLSEEAKAKARQALETVGLAQRAGESAEGLYGPIRTRLELARTLIAAPKLIVLNRPANGVGDEEADEMRASLQAVAARGPALLLFDLDLPALLRICPRLMLLEDGKKRADDTPAALRADKALAETYVALQD